MDDPSVADRMATPALAAGTAMTFRIDFEPSDAADARRPGAEPGHARADAVASAGVSSMLEGAEGEVAREIEAADEFASRAAMDMDAGAEALAVDRPEAEAQPGMVPPVEFRPSVATRPGKLAKPRPPRPAAPPRRRAMPQILGSVLLGLLGAAAGYYGLRYEWVEPVKIHPLVEPLDPVLLGGLLGLLIGWVAVRWTAKRH